MVKTDPKQTSVKPGADTQLNVGVTDRQRLDVWLWHARLAKTRTLAQALIARGKVRVNRAKVARPSHAIKVGDAITISLGPRIRILTVLAFAARRGSATTAQALYQELTPAPVRTKPAEQESAVDAPLSSSAPAPAIRDPGQGRPTKRDRRALDRLKGRFDDS